MTTTQPGTPPSPPRSAPAGPPTLAAGAGATLDPVRLLKRYKVPLIIAAIVGVVLGVAVYFPLRRYFPRYESTSVFQCDPPLEEAGGIGLRVQAAEMTLFMESQVQDMMSTQVLLAAVQTGKVRETQWARQFGAGTNAYDIAEAARELEKIARARVIPDTFYILLSTRAGTAVDATTINTVIGEIYSDQRFRRTRADTESRREAITTQIRAAENASRELTQRIQTLLGDSGADALDQRQSEARRRIDTLIPQMAEMRSQIELMRERLTSYEAAQQRPEGIVYPEEIRGEIQNHPAIQRHDAQIQMLKTELRAARVRFGPRHISVRNLENALNAARVERDADEQRLLATHFQTVIDGMRSMIAGLQASLNDSNAQLQEALTRARELSQVIDAYEALVSERDRRAEQIVDLRGALNDVDALLGRTGATRVTLVQSATIPERPVFPMIQIVTPVVAILCVGLVAGVILLREVLEQRVRAPADVLLIPKARLLGVVADVADDPSRPVSVPDAVRDQPDGVVAEQVRQIRVALTKRAESVGQTPVVLIASGMPGSGSTSVAAALARSYAAMHKRVLVIDANMRKPNLHERFGLAASPGLGDVLSGASTLADTAQKADGDDNLHVLGAGSREHRRYERLNSDTMSDLLDEARRMYDIVLIDAPPMVVASDAMVLAGRCDLSVLVVKAYQETRGLVGRVGTQLTEAKAHYMGVIVNGVRASAGGYYRRNFEMAHRYHAQGSGSASGSKKGS